MDKYMHIGKIMECNKNMHNKEHNEIYTLTWQKVSAHHYKACPPLQCEFQ